MKSFLEISKERYTTKHYDPKRKISDDDLNTLKEILRLTPSAVNIQPWFFYFGTTEAAKLKIMPAIPDFNIPRIQGCSCFVVLCSKTRMTDDDLSAITKKEDADGRYGDRADIREAVDTHRKVFADMHAELGDFAHWTAKQTYIAMATLLYGAASMNIDSTPIEGVDYEMMDEILHLKEKHLKTVAMVSLGYRAENDSNQSRPKSRLDLKDISASLD